MSIKLKPFLLFLLFASASVLHAQDDVYNEGYAMLQKGQYVEAIAKFEKVVEANPYHADADSKIAYCKLLLGQVDEAERRADLAMQKDPTQLTVQAVKAYMEMARGRLESAKSYLNVTFFQCGDNDYLKFFEEDFVLMKSKNIQPELCDQLMAWMPGAYASRNRTYATYEKYVSQIIKDFENNDPQNGLKHAQLADQTLTQFPAEFKFLTPLLRDRIGQNLYRTEGWREALPYLERGWTESKNYSQLPPLSIFLMATDLATFYAAVQDYEKQGAVSMMALNNYALPPGTAYFTGNMLVSVGRSLMNLAKYEEVKDVGVRLLQVAATTGSYPYFEAYANNFLGAAYIQSIQRLDREKGKAHFEKAYAIAKANGFDDLAEALMSNLALSYWQDGNRPKAVQTYRDLAALHKGKQNWAEAEEALSGLGGLLYFAKDYAAAVPVYAETIAINEEARQKLPPDQRIRYMQRVENDYSCMVGALSSLGDARRAFEVQNQQRARVLEESLVKSQPTVTSLEQFQRLLKPGEAAIFYSLVEAGVVNINVITSTSAKVQKVTDYRRFVNLKAQFLDKRNADKPGYKPVSQKAVDYRGDSEEDVIAQQIGKDDFNDLVGITRGLLQKSDPVFAPVRQRYLRDFYDFLIAPIQSQLINTTSLLIFPDGILNFIPFEALMSSDNKYVIEKYNVRYCQSASVFHTVNGRSYAAARKSFLGMGGAVYERMAEKNNAKSEINDEVMVQFQIEAEANAANGRSQRDIYATLFTGDKMNYLQGTLLEVENLRKIFANGTVLTGREMTENRIKAMSQSGELGQYKILHLATHGFALSEIPPLSGVAMCIFTNMQSNEDGYLTASEISNLKLNADLVVLSACETALGKIYGGEGVVGLTASLLQAGANETYVSLWPVNDEGTMYFMTGMYELVVKQGKSYAEAGDIMKRKFIGGEFGEEFKAPTYWAPFVHFGK